MGSARGRGSDCGSPRRYQRAPHPHTCSSHPSYRGPVRGGCSTCEHTPAKVAAVGKGQMGQRPQCFAVARRGAETQGRRERRGAGGRATGGRGHRSLHCLLSHLPSRKLRAILPQSQSPSAPCSATRSLRLWSSAGVKKEGLLAGLALGATARGLFPREEDAALRDIEDAGDTELPASE